MTLAGDVEPPLKQRVTPFSDQPAAAARPAQPGARPGPVPEAVFLSPVFKPVRPPAPPPPPVPKAAQVPPDPVRTVLVGGPEELRTALTRPFVVWRSFLHPAQRELAYRESYGGPAQVSGGAGTGKTMIALHRTAHLAQRLADSPDGGTVLLTTYARNLAEVLDRQLSLLVADPRARERVEVTGIDWLASRIVRDALGRHPQVIGEHEHAEAWQAAARESGLGYSGGFLLREWEQVILAQDIRTEEEYLSCARPGRGAPLPRARRAAVWQVIQRQLARFREADRWTYLQLADEAARILAARERPPYRHVVVDEAQDLHPAQWRLLRAAVAPGPDDLFIVGDPHQRIYNHRVSLASLGIDVRGRSRRVKINYRTTQEILDWAVALLGGGEFTGLDDVVDDLAGYRSPVHGDPPKVYAAADLDDELNAVVTQVAAWLAAGVEPSSVAVISRFFPLARRVRKLLAAAGVPATFMGSSSAGDAVQVGAMHKAKGLEFRCVAVIGVSAELIPAPGVLTDPAEDPLTHELDLQRERCLLFVACTRARDRLYVSYTGAPSPFLPAAS